MVEFGRLTIYPAQCLKTLCPPSIIDEKGGFEVRHFEWLMRKQTKLLFTERDSPLYHISEGPGMVHPCQLILLSYYDRGGVLTHGNAAFASSSKKRKRLQISLLAAMAFSSTLEVHSISKYQKLCSQPTLDDGRGRFIGLSHNPLHHLHIDSDAHPLSPLRRGRWGYPLIKSQSQCPHLPTVHRDEILEGDFFLRTRFSPTQQQEFSSLQVHQFWVLLVSILPTSGHLQPTALTSQPATHLWLF